MFEADTTERTSEVPVSFCVIQNERSLTVGVVRRNERQRSGLLNN